MGRWSNMALFLVAACAPAAPTPAEIASPRSPAESPTTSSRSAPHPVATSAEDGALGAGEEAEHPASGDQAGAARGTIEPLERSRFLSQRDLAAFNDVCQLKEGKEGVGCDCCPLDDPCPGSGEDEPLTTIEHTFHGAFSAEGVEEVFATGTSYGCGNLSGWGVTWFLRRVGDEYELVAGHANTHHVLHGTIYKRDDGRRDVVAHDIISKNAYESIVHLTFAADGEATRHELLTWMNGGCARRRPGFHHAVVDYVGANATDYDGDGHRDLVVSLDVRRRFADEAFARECGQWYESDGTGPSPIEKMPPKRVAVPLLFDGRTFTPDAKALERFEKLTAVVDRQGN